MTSLLKEIEASLLGLPPEELGALARDVQKATAQFQKWVMNPGPQTDAYYSEADELFYGGEAGGGKALANEELIVTPFGFRPIGALRIGETVCAADGTPTKIIGVFPQSVRPLYRVTFQDGASVLADADHRWNYSLAGVVWGKSGRPWKVGTTSQLATMLEGGSRPMVPLCGPLKFTKAYKTPQRIIDPYVLGLLLGDGYTKQSGPGAKWSFTSLDPEILSSLPGEWVHDGGPNWRLRGPWRVILLSEFKRMGLAGKGSSEKFIPEAYKWAGVDDRLAVLQGLMDTDGTSDDRGHASFTSTSKVLAEDVAWLVASLGGRASISEKKTTHRPAFTVYIRTADSSNLFRLSRKAARGTAYQHGQPKRRIVSITYERDGEATCIAVDHPDSLYVVGKACIVTHNTDLLLGTAISGHRRSLILRRLNAEVEGLIDRMVEIVGHSRGLKRNPPASWRFPHQVVLFGGCQYLEDRKKYQGVPKDFIGFDELPNFLEAQYEFIIAWARSTHPGQRVRVIGAGNPPTTAEGMWVIRRWGPWLDPNHPSPALPGELRWFTTIDGRDTEVEGPGPVMIDGKPLLDGKGQPILPKSRTFIPAELDDNPDLAETNYSSVLSNLPEELRRAMKEGDFSASQTDDEWQVFPAEWVDQAMARWDESGRRAPMTVIGVDIAQGGKDNTTIAPRHGSWFDKIDVFPGKETPDGPTVAGLIVMKRRDGCEVIIDMGGGYGGSTYDHLKPDFQPTLYNGSATKEVEGVRDRTGTLRFFNVRAAAHWHLREALDPQYGAYIALPPDPILKADLTAIRWKMTARGVQVEDKASVKGRIGRSPDRSDAVVMAHFAKGKTNNTRIGIGNLQTRVSSSSRKPKWRP